MGTKISNFGLIIGAGKCGTTSLFNYLTEHPEIAPCNIKEPNFFCQQDKYERGFDYYQNLWNWDSSKHKIALEASVNYSKSTDPNLLNASDNIAKIQQKYGVDFKFIYLIRNPLERIQSEINYSFYRGYNDDWETFSAEARSKSRIDTSKYAMQLAQYYQRFPSENILIINFEVFKKNPSLVVSQICQFLNIDSNYSFQGLDRAYNTSSQSERISIPGYSLLRSSKVVKRIVESTSYESREKLKSLLKFSAGKVEKRKYKLSPEQRNFIFKEIETDLQDLRTKHGINLQDWNFDAQN